MPHCWKRANGWPAAGCCWRGVRMSELPDGWAMAALGELVTEVRNGISAKPSSEDGLPILRISAVRPLKLDATDVRYLPPDFAAAKT